MTRQELADAVAQYKSGLEAGVELLRRLEAAAVQQRRHTQARDYERMAADSDQREQLTRALVAIEPGLRRIRAELMRVDERLLTGRPDYGSVLALRESARALVSAILAVDAASMQSLADAELAQRSAMASLEAGGNTLAAYRRVLAPPVASASLVNERG